MNVIDGDETLARDLLEARQREVARLAGVAVVLIELVEVLFEELADDKEMLFEVKEI